MQHSNGTMKLEETWRFKENVTRGQLPLKLFQCHSISGSNVWTAWQDKGSGIVQEFRKPWIMKPFPDTIMTLRRPGSSEIGMANVFDEFGLLISCFTSFRAFSALLQCICPSGWLDDSARSSLHSFYIEMKLIKCFSKLLVFASLFTMDFDSALLAHFLLEFREESQLVWFICLLPSANDISLCALFHR